jgi:hypothetical protein
MSSKGGAKRSKAIRIQVFSSFFLLITVRGQYSVQLQSEWRYLSCGYITEFLVRDLYCHCCFALAVLLGYV